MSSFIQIIIEGKNLPPRGELASKVDAEELIDSSDSYTVKPGEIVIEWYDEKWGLDDGLSFCQDVSEAYPELHVQYTDEWDARDADEPGKTGYRWYGGKIIAEGTQEFIWKNVTPITQ